jgi:CheY-like chemotaxis protein
MRPCDFISHRTQRLRCLEYRECSAARSRCSTSSLGSVAAFHLLLLAFMATCVAAPFSPQPSVAYFLRTLLESAGLTVTSASFHEDDLEAVVRRDRPEVIVYDVSFPFTENWSRLQQLQRRPAFRSIPIVITTSEARTLYRSVGVSAAIEVFTRPTDVSELRAAVQRALDGCAIHA